MHIRPGFTLAALAAASWGAVIAADTLNWHAHIYICTLVVAACATAFTFQWLMVSNLRHAIDRQNAAYKELAQAVASLMADPKMPGAGPALRAVPAHGRHASSG